MKINFTRQLMAALILTVLMTGFSCAKKNIASQPDTTSTSGSVSEVEASDQNQADREREEAIRAQELQDKLAREREATQAQLAAVRNQFTNQHILFEFDSAELDETAKAQVREKAEWIRINQSALITIEGHCDQRGTTSYNLALGERRALAVKNYLEDLGIPKARVGWVSFGEEQPLDKNNSNVAHSQNRRAQFRIQNKVASTLN